MPQEPSQTIGIIALSSACEPRLLQRGLEYLRSIGLKDRLVLSPEQSYGQKTHLFSSDSPENRARALEKLFEDPQVSCILAVRGAYGGMEVLPLLDFRKIAKFSKPLVGFSDTTALLIALHQCAGIPAVHGPSLASSFGKASEDMKARASVEALLSFLSGDCRASALNGPVRRLCGNDAEVRGQVTGGNLSILTALIATPWEAKLDGKILFLEEVGESPYRIHRMLLQMKLAGRLDKLRAVVLGEFLDCEHKQGLGPNVEEALIDIFKNLNYPVVGYVNAGHGPLNKPVPLGSSLRITGTKLELEEKAVLS